MSIDAPSSSASQAGPSNAELQRRDDIRAAERRSGELARMAKASNFNAVYRARRPAGVVRGMGAVIPPRDTNDAGGPRRGGGGMAALDARLNGRSTADAPVAHADATIASGGEIDRTGAAGAGPVGGAEDSGELPDDTSAIESPGAMMSAEASNRLALEAMMAPGDGAGGGGGGQSSHEMPQGGANEHGGRAPQDTDAWERVLEHAEVTTVGGDPTARLVLGASVLGGLAVEVKDVGGGRVDLRLAGVQRGLRADDAQVAALVESLSARDIHVARIRCE